MKLIRVEKKKVNPRVKINSFMNSVIKRTTLAATKLNRTLDKIKSKQQVLKWALLVVCVLMLVAVGFMIDMYVVHKNGQTENKLYYHLGVGIFSFVTAFTVGALDSVSLIMSKPEPEQGEESQKLLPAIADAGSSGS